MFEKRRQAEGRRSPPSRWRSSAARLHSSKIYKLGLAARPGAYQASRRRRSHPPAAGAAAPQGATHARRPPAPHLVPQLRPSAAASGPPPVETKELLSREITMPPCCWVSSNRARKVCSVALTDRRCASLQTTAQCAKCTVGGKRVSVMLEWEICSPHPSRRPGAPRCRGSAGNRRAQGRRSSNAAAAPAPAS